MATVFDYPPPGFSSIGKSLGSYSRLSSDEAGSSRASSSAGYGGTHTECDTNIANWPPGLSYPPELPGAPPLRPDHRPFISPTATISAFRRRFDLCRVFSGTAIAPAVGTACGVAVKACIATAVAAHAVVLAPIAVPAAVGIGAVASIATFAGMAKGPIQRVIRAHVRDCFHSVAGGIAEGGYTDPGFAARDAADDEESDLPTAGVEHVVSTGKKVRRKRCKHFAPYANGQVRGAYLCSLVAEIRTLYAGRARDSTTEHAARRALVTRMRDHGMRNTDIDKVREHCVNAVFYVSRDDEAAAMVNQIGQWLGLQRGPGDGY